MQSFESELDKAQPRLGVSDSPIDDEKFHEGGRNAAEFVLEQAETGVFPEWQAMQFGPMELNMKMDPMPIGSIQSIVSVGFRPTGGILFIEGLSSSMFRLGWQRQNKIGGGSESAK